MSDFILFVVANHALQPTPVGRRRWFVKVQVVLHAQSGVAELGRSSAGPTRVRFVALNFICFHDLIVSRFQISR